MTTSAVTDFAEYTKEHGEEGVSVFVDPLKMQATAVLNLGKPECPGHADNLAVYAPTRTAAYSALLAIANGTPKTQKDVAEFMEDWGPDFIAAFHADEEIPHRQAVAAIRRVTIESLSKSENAQEQLSVARTAFDQVKAVSTEGQIPTLLEFVCEPYWGMKSRVFTLRLGILTSDKAPAITLRIVKKEEHDEKMAKELVADVVAAIEDVPVILGGYVAK